MSFLKKLFGGGSNAKSEPTSLSYQGYEIRAEPRGEGGQFRLSGTISKEIDGAVKEHVFIRADIFSSKEDAVNETIRKAKILIEEQGDRIFR